MLCLHCGNLFSFKRQGYCEDCYQKLVSENLKLQIRVKELEKQLQKEHEPKHMKGENESEKI